MDMEKFSNVPVEPDTTIVSEAEVVLGEIPALHQQWTWEGLIAESFIFISEDVSHLNDEKLFELVKENYVIGEDERHTVKRSQSGYTFVNFNFKDFEDLLFE
jgi:hypothetical protein